MLGKILNIVTTKNAQERNAKLYQDLIKAEAKIGGEIFGPLPKGARREFFCLDEHTWVWHEESRATGQQKITTTTYSVRNDGILKSINGGQYMKLGSEEAQKLLKAAEIYQKRINEKLYKSINTN